MTIEYKSYQAMVHEPTILGIITGYVIRIVASAAFLLLAWVVFLLPDSAFVSLQDMPSAILEPPLILFAFSPAFIAAKGFREFAADNMVSGIMAIILFLLLSVIGWRMILAF